MFKIQNILEYTDDSPSKRDKGGMTPFVYDDKITS